MTTITVEASDPAEIAAELWDGWHGDLAFDVGANIGQSTPALLGRFARVISFEPAAEAWNVLSRLHADGLTCLNVAVSDRDSTVLLYGQRDSLLQGHLISPEVAGYHALPGPKTPRRVPCRTLDSLAAEYGLPDMVKIDTEGHELKILEGAGDLLARRAAGWLVEFHSRTLADGCLAVLAGAGYEPRVIRHPHYLPGSDQSLNHGYIRADPKLLPERA